MRDLLAYVQTQGWLNNIMDSVNEQLFASLNDLVERGLITQEERKKNGKIHLYYALTPLGETALAGGVLNPRRRKR